MRSVPSLASWPASASGQGRPGTSTTGDAVAGSANEAANLDTVDAPWLSIPCGRITVQSDDPAVGAFTGARTVSSVMKSAYNK